MDRDSIDILIIFFNKVEQTICCINSFLASGQQIYVLNNGSDAKQESKLRNRFKGVDRIHILNSGKNLGPAGGRNYLIKHTQSKWIFFVDNDIVIEPSNGWLEKFFCYIANYTSAEVICPRIYNVHEGLYMDRLNVVISDNKLVLQRELSEVTNFFPEGGAIVNRSVFDRNGLYDEELFAFEGYEFALRALRSMDGEIKVHHTNEFKLIHNHSFQKMSKDKEAVRERYNEHRMKASYDRLINEYNITFSHDWHWWTKNQVAIMTTPKLILRIKQKISNILNR